MSQVTGRAYISINAVRVRSKPGARLMIGGERATPVIGDPTSASRGVENEFRGAHVKVPNPTGVDFTYEYVPPTLDFKISDLPNIGIDDLRRLRGATIVFETDTGKVFTISGASIAEPPSLSPSSGEWELRFVGRECIAG